VRIPRQVAMASATAFSPAPLAYLSLIVILLSLSSSSLSLSAHQDLAAPPVTLYNSLGRSGLVLRPAPVMTLRGGAEVEGEPVRDEVPQEPIPPDPTKVYVGNLPQKVADDALKEFLSAAGEIVQLEVKRYKSTGFCKGYAMATFASEEEASTAVKTLAGGSFANRSVLVKPDAGYDPELAEKRKKIREEKSQSGEPRKGRPMGHPRFWPRCPQGRRVYVGNIKFGTSWQQVRDVMAGAGQVEFGRILKTATTMHDGSIRHVSKGFAIVHYADEESARKAVETLDGTMLNGRGLRIKPDMGRGAGMQGKGPAPAGAEGGDAPLEQAMENLDVGAAN